MPAEQRGEAYRLGKGRYGLRYRDNTGARVRTREKFASRTAALNHYRDVIAPMLRGDTPAVDDTLAAFIDTYLERHAANVRPQTIDTIRDRLRRAIAAFGDVRLSELEHMTDDIAAWAAKLPARSRHDYVRALRQVLEAAARWRRITGNPAKAAGPNPKPPRRPIRAYTRPELDAIAAELSPAHAPIVDLGAATGLRPEEWAALERSDIDKRAGVLNVRRTVTGGKRKGNPIEIVELAKTSASRRQVPLSPRALAAIDALPPRLDTPLLFPAPDGGPIRLDNFRRRVWRPAVEAAGIDTPARIYDLRSTFASNAIAAGIDAFELARVMGTSIEMIEHHYGTLLSGAAAGIASRLAAFEAAQDEAHARSAE